MSDLIDRQAAIDVARKCPVVEVTPAYMLIDKAEVMTDLMLLPSAQPEIIRCKYCKHYEQDVMGNPWGVCCHPDWTHDNCGSSVDENGWCYRAERREE